MSVAFRHATHKDEPFVISGWSASYRTTESAGLIQMVDWATVMHPQIRKAMKRPDVETIVAYEGDDPGFLYGFIVADPTVPLVYYCYVKQPYRRAGYARALFAAMHIDPAKPFEYACESWATAELAPKIPLAKWNPLAARFPKPSVR